MGTHYALLAELLGVDLLVLGSGLSGAQVDEAQQAGLAEAREEALKRIVRSIIESLDRLILDQTRALAALDAEIAAAQSRPPSTILFKTSKGL